jgi:hypothetical protein
VKDIHVVCKKKTKNGPKRVIFKSTTNFYGTDVICLLLEHNMIRLIFKKESKPWPIIYNFQKSIHTLLVSQIHGVKGGTFSARSNEFYA